MATLLSACRSEPAIDKIVTPVHLEFEELFAVADTVRLDHSVLVGSVSMLSVNSSGELLVQDNQSGGVHLYSSTGMHLRTFSIADCNPEAALVGFGSHSTFLGDSRILVITSKGAVVFDRSGRCVLSSTNADFVTDSWSACSFRDTIFVMPRGIRDSTYIRAYSSDLSFVGKFALPAPRFPRRGDIMLPFPGRTLGCFADDVWWMYGEDFDASPRLRSTGLTQFRPGFYQPRTRDYPELPLVTQSNWEEVNRVLTKAEAEASSTWGMFALDAATRLVMYSNVDGSQSDRVMGALVAQHQQPFRGITTLIHGMPDAAGSGMLYFTEDPEDRPDGELANPLIVRYRFISPHDWEG